MLERHPGLWNRVGDMRSMRGTALQAPTNRGKTFPNWPDWCYFPRGMAAVALVTDRKDADQTKVAHELESEAVAALAAWRMTQGIYRFDSTLFCELSKTSIEGEIPVDVFRRLPEWCVYVEVPEDVLALHGITSVHGVFVYRDCDDEEGDGNLHLILDLESGYLKALMPLPLGGGTIMESVERRLEGNRKVRVEQILNEAASSSSAVTKEEVEEWFGDVARDTVATTVKEMAPYISLVLYICSVNSDLRDRSGRRDWPANPQPVKAPTGMKTHPAGAVTVWDVGCRVGPALRRALELHGPQAPERPNDEVCHHASPRPHIRAAHWHSFWTGPKASPSRLLVVKWLPPIPVNVDGPDDLIPTLRGVD
jgi:hypothetical protein